MLLSDVPHLPVGDKVEKLTSSSLRVLAFILILVASNMLPLELWNIWGYLGFWSAKKVALRAETN